MHALFVSSFLNLIDSIFVIVWCLLIKLSGSFLFWPPVFFYASQLRIICCYIARYYVKKLASAPGRRQRYKTTKLRGQNRSDLCYFCNVL